MTIAELARAFNARGSGKRIRAKCPVHRSRSLTLALYDDGDKLSVHCHAGCNSDDVLAAIGLSWRDLRRERLSSEAYRELMKTIKDKEKLAKLDRDYGLMLWLSALETSEYWLREASRTGREHNALYRKIYPELAAKKQAERDLQAKIKRIGWDAMWEEYEDDQRRLLPS